MVSDSSESTKMVGYFAAGPSKLPREVLLDAQNELLQYEESKISVLEMSHRSSEFKKIVTEAEALVREVLDVPSNYKVLFMQGGGTGQFSCVPLNLMSKTGKADYLVTGSWSEKAAKEAEKFGEVHLVAPISKPFNRVPPEETWNFSSDASYVYYCDNETVEGVEFPCVPEVPSGIPLVCDMSSNICTRPVDISKFGVIFAGAQKNIGCAGTTVVIAREDLLGHAFKHCPSIFDYEKMSKQGSLLNTPPTFSIYVLKKVMSWVLHRGGIPTMHDLSREKSRMLFEVIDNSGGFYSNSVQPCDRSRMNITFRIGGLNGCEELESAFINDATSKGLLSLKGHRSVGGIRASVYNAVSLKDVKKLVDFMNHFKKIHKKDSDA